ncbi:hypothetical protein PIB30_006588 [Stylosanthes scabra]|uniref:Uncharacterized protein n=1 Tax=Stylosanthes scabra TaxID=79078 RepID=A0ABU6Y2E6_9FABA|nr:hypothetical protein [Stylosanthes scabra]
MVYIQTYSDVVSINRKVRRRFQNSYQIVQLYSDETATVGWMTHMWGEVCGAWMNSICHFLSWLWLQMRAAAASLVEPPKQACMRYKRGKMACLMNWVAK